MKVAVHHLSRHFGHTKAVDDISFAFTSGQIFGFIGPNGAGKTTTMRIMATLDEPTAGDVTLDGQSICQNPESARKRVGFMPDALPTHRDLTVHEYLDFFARAYGIKNPQRRQVLEDVEAFTNLGDLRHKTLQALSKGMKQRVSLARSIVHDPPLLILDEPAAGLDPRARVELRELLKVLAQQGKAILISSHILTELAEVCHGAVIIEHGRIIAAGTMDDIMHGGAGSTGAGSGCDGNSGGGPRIKVHIKPLGPPEPLRKAMLEMPHVESAEVVGDGVEAEIRGSVDLTCEILADLIRRDFKIMEFRQHRAQLEEIFMSVTRGEVS